MRLKINFNFFKYIYIFVLGFFGFSCLGQYLLLDVLNFSFFLVELFFIPLIYKYLYPSIKTFFHKNSVGLTFLFFFLLISMVMSIVNTRAISNLLEYRSILYLFFVFCYVRKNGVDIDLQHIMYVSIFSVLSELVFILVINDDATVSSLNMVTIATSVILPFILEKYVIGIGMFGIAFVSGITSGYRIGIVVPAVALVVSLGYMIVRNDKTKSGLTRLKRLFVVGVFAFAAVVLVVNYITVVEFLAKKFNMDSFAIFRVTNRLISTLKGDIVGMQDIGRIELLKIPVEQFWDYWFPLGLDMNYNSLYIDVPIMYFYSIFGSVVSWVLCIAIFIKAAIKIPLLFKRKETSIAKSDTRYEVFGLLMFPALLTTFIINGTFLLNAYQAIFTGVVLGFLFSGKVKEAEYKCKEK